METSDERPGGAASDVVAACEGAWRSFQAHHPELPNAIVILGSGVDRGRLVKLGHWWGGRWEAGNELRGEVLLAGEALHLPVEDVFEVLLHEAAHGLNAARGVKDTSRGGRYHNARFKATAESVGLDVEMMPPYGWAKTSLTPAAIERYGGEIDQLRAAIRIARRLDPIRTTAGGAEQGGDGLGGPEPGTAGSADGGHVKSPSMACGCGRRIRMAPSVGAQGPVLCGLCGSEFTVRAPFRPASTPRDGVPQRLVSAEHHARSAAGTDATFAVVRDWLDTPDCRVVAAQVEAWVEQSGGTDGYVELRGGDPYELNVLVHAIGRAHGLLSGPDLEAGSVLLAGGDIVVVSSTPDGDRDVVPDVGVVGEVVACDPMRRSLIVDFPIAGQYQLTATDAGLHLSYGYAIPNELADRPIRRPGPAPAIPSSELVVDGIEIGLP